MRDAACDTGAIIADAVALAELPGGTGHGGWGRSASTAGWPFRCPSPTPWSPRSCAPAALGCCVGEDMHAPTERIRADSIAVGASQLQAVLAEILDRPNPIES